MNRPFPDEVLEVMPERLKQAKHELFPRSTPHIMTHVDIRGIGFRISLGLVCLGPVLRALFSMCRLYSQSLSFGASGDNTTTTVHCLERPCPVSWVAFVVTTV